MSESDEILALVAQLRAGKDEATCTRLVSFTVSVGEGGALVVDKTYEMAPQLEEANIGLGKYNIAGYLAYIASDAADFADGLKRKTPGAG